MMVLLKRTLPVCCLLIASGCVTDEVVVFKDAIVGKDAAKQFLGVYKVEEWPGDMRPESIRVTEADGKQSFSYSLAGNEIKVQFVVSKIPKSEQDLFLLSVPGQDDTKQANLFFIGKREKEKTSIWAVLSTLRVARDNLSFQIGKAKANDVKQFLMNHADAFVAANKPVVTLVNP